LRAIARCILQVGNCPLARHTMPPSQTTSITETKPTDIMARKTVRTSIADSMPRPGIGMSASHISFAPTLLTGNPVGVNGVHADQHAGNHHRIGG
jgi:hypothetical protein